MNGISDTTPTAMRDTQDEAAARERTSLEIVPLDSAPQESQPKAGAASTSTAVQGSQQEAGSAPSSMAVQGSRPEAGATSTSNALHPGRMIGPEAASKDRPRRQLATAGVSGRDGVGPSLEIVPVDEAATAAVIAVGGVREGGGPDRSVLCNCHKRPCLLCTGL